MQKKRIFFFFYIKTLFSKFGGSGPSGQRSVTVSHRGQFTRWCILLLGTHSSVTSCTHALRKHTPQSLRDSSPNLGEQS